ncbi:hypothetical protein OEA41_002255 [Lepraria neglecta]|uniref:Uncharacterized protein n=1 Tax=Lepraria neglecta TaxID=209136 RepID=A0AAD9ZB97_9LECA|nr:hypothetical protein OEA41_002255 [Lepraria neglecta]
MICLLLSFLFLPFTILATPITLGEVGNLTLTDLTNSTGDPQLQKTCPAPPPDSTPITFGFDKIGFIGWIETDSLTICLDVNAIFQLTHCYGSLRNSESVECGFDEWLAKGDIKLYIKNEYELWLHLEGTIFKKSWNKDIHILNIPHNQGVGTAAASNSGLVSPPMVTASASAQTTVPNGISGVMSAVPVATSVALAQIPSPSGSGGGNTFQVSTQPDMNGGAESS